MYPSCIRQRDNNKKLLRIIIQTVKNIQLKHKRLRVKRGRTNQQGKNRLYNEITGESSHEGPQWRSCSNEDGMNVPKKSIMGGKYSEMDK